MERAILVNVAATKAEKDEAEESMTELSGLAVAAGAEVAARQRNEVGQRREGT